MAEIVTASTIIAKYAAEIREINEKGTEGDFTWEGLLYSALRDVADAGIDLTKELGR